MAVASEGSMSSVFRNTKETSVAGAERRRGDGTQGRRGEREPGQHIHMLKHVLLCCLLPRKCLPLNHLYSLPLLDIVVCILGFSKESHTLTKSPFICGIILRHDGWPF